MHPADAAAAQSLSPSGSDSGSACLALRRVAGCVLLSSFAVVVARQVTAAAAVWFSAQRSCCSCCGTMPSPVSCGGPPALQHEGCELAAGMLRAPGRQDSL
jgi:hypothetical protein